MNLYILFLFFILSVNAFCDNPLQKSYDCSSFLSVVPTKESGLTKSDVDKVLNNVQCAFLNTEELVKFTTLKGQTLIKSGCDFNSNILYAINKSGNYLIFWGCSRDGAYYTTLDPEKCILRNDNGELLKIKCVPIFKTVSFGTTLDVKSVRSASGWGLYGYSYKIDDPNSKKITIEFYEARNNTPWGTIKYPLKIECNWSK